MQPRRVTGVCGVGEVSRRRLGLMSDRWLTSERRRDRIGFFIALVVIVLAGEVAVLHWPL